MMKQAVATHYLEEVSCEKNVHVAPGLLIEQRREFEEVQGCCFTRRGSRMAKE